MRLIRITELDMWTVTHVEPVICMRSTIWLVDVVDPLTGAQPIHLGIDGVGSVVHYEWQHSRRLVSAHQWDLEESSRSLREPRTTCHGLPIVR